MYDYYIEVFNRINNNLDKFPSVGNNTILDYWEFNDEDSIIINTIDCDNNATSYMIDCEYLTTDEAFEKWLNT